MLAKLLKYDLRALLRASLPVWALALVLCFINHFTLTGALSTLEGFGFSMARGLLVVAMAVAFVAMVVLPLVLIIQRFYSGLLRDEGYLMFTLPVRTWQLVLSKAIAAVILTLLSILVAAGCALLLSDWRDIHLTFLSGGEAWLLALEYFLVLVLTIGASVYRVYAAIALGHLFQKHRVVMAFVMYFVIDAVLSILGLTSARGLFNVFSAIDFAQVLEGMEDISVLGLGSLGALGLALVEGVQAVIFHIVTERILSRRLNLE